MLDLGRIPLHAKDPHAGRSTRDLRRSGGAESEILAPFIDIFVIGDGEESLPWIMEQWMIRKERAANPADRRARADMIAEVIGSVNWAYAPQFYEPEYHADGTIAQCTAPGATFPREVVACTITPGFR